MAGFVTGVVSVVDSEGKRIDTPNENGDYAPIELKLGNTLTATKTTNGSLTQLEVNALASALAGIWTSGTEAAADEIGLNGDFFLNRTTKVVYQKIGGVYVEVGTMASAAPSIHAFVPADFLVASAATVGETGHNGGNETLAVQFCLTPGLQLQVMGVRFYWVHTGNETVRCELWDPMTTTVSAARSKDVVTAGAGFYDAMFTSPFMVPTNRDAAPLFASFWEISGTKSCYLNGGADNANIPARPWQDGRVVWKALNSRASTHAYPGSTGGTSDFYPVGPILAPVA